MMRRRKTRSLDGKRSDEDDDIDGTLEGHRMHGEQQPRGQRQRTRHSGFSLNENVERPTLAK